MKQLYNKSEYDEQFRQLNKIELSQREQSESLQHVIIKIDRMKKRQKIKRPLTIVGVMAAALMLFSIVWLLSDQIIHYFNTNTIQTPPPIIDNNDIDKDTETELFIEELEAKPTLAELIEGNMYDHKPTYLSKFNSDYGEWSLAVNDYRIESDNSKIIFQSPVHTFDIVTPFENAFVGPAQLSGDGILALEVSESQHFPKHLYIVDLNEGKKLFSIDETVINDHNVTSFAWSPDSQSVALGVGHPAEEQLAIYHFETNEFTVVNGYFFLGLLNKKWSKDMSYIDFVDGDIDSYVLYRYYISEKSLYKLYDLTREEFDLWREENKTAENDFHIDDATWRNIEHLAIAEGLQSSDVTEKHLEKWSNPSKELEQMMVLKGLDQDFAQLPLWVQDYIQSSPFIYEQWIDREVYRERILEAIEIYPELNVNDIDALVNETVEELLNRRVVN